MFSFATKNFTKLLAVMAMSVFAIGCGSSKSGSDPYGGYYPGGHYPGGPGGQAGVRVSTYNDNTGLGFRIDPQTRTAEGVIAFTNKQTGQTYVMSFASSHYSQGHALVGVNYDAYSSQPRNLIEFHQTQWTHNGMQVAGHLRICRAVYDIIARVYHTQQQYQQNPYSPYQQHQQYPPNVNQWNYSQMDCSQKISLPFQAHLGRANFSHRYQGVLIQ